MIIAGLEKTTIIDYPGKIAAIVFTHGCNFRCPFCHNPAIVIGQKGKDYEETKEEDFFKFLEKRKNVLEGVVITGGEPLMNKDIGEFIKKIKEMGFAVKLDTNGGNPEKLQKLLDKKLIDFIAMDIKNSFEKYGETTGVKVDIDKISKSIEMIKNSGLPYEFRSTILPRLHKKEDFEKMGKMIKGADNFYIQGFRRGITLDSDFENEESFTFKELEEIKVIFQKHVKKAEIRSNL